MKKTIYYIKDFQVMEDKIKRQIKEKVIQYSFYSITGGIQEEVDTYLLISGEKMRAEDCYSTQLEAFNRVLRDMKENDKATNSFIADSLRNIAERLSPKKDCDCYDKD